MGKVIWSPAALADVEAVAEYIARDSSDQAAIFVGRLTDAVDRLREHSRSGRTIPEIGSDACREIIVASYRIMYRVEDDDVWITGIVHGARDWKP
jgi:addiction module RelE/StbE family toxin